MSEAVATIIKILGSLTSPKASIKFLSVAIFMLLTWKHIDNYINLNGVPIEQRDVIVLFFGIGVGTLIGHVSYTLFECFLKKYRRFKVKKESELAIQHAERDELVAEENERIIILNNFKKVYPYYYFRVKKILRELSVKDCCYKWRDDNIDVPLKNGYIFKVLNVDSEQDIYKLHPALVDFVSTEWDSEVNYNMTDFFEDYDRVKEILINFLEFNNDDEKISNPFEIINMSRMYGMIFKVELEDSNGAYI